MGRVLVTLCPCIDTGQPRIGSSLPGADPTARQYNVDGLEEANHAGLIGRIGEAGAPFLVGSEPSSTADTEGRLFLGINDTGVGNSAGEFTATITVNPS